MNHPNCKGSSKWSQAPGLHRRSNVVRDHFAEELHYELKLKLLLVHTVEP